MCRSPGRASSRVHVCPGDSARRGLGSVRGEQLGRAGARRARRGRVVEDQRRGQPQPGGRREPVAQLDRGERVEAQFLERLCRPDPPRRRACPSTAAASARTSSTSSRSRSAGRPRPQPLGQPEPDDVAIGEPPEGAGRPGTGDRGGAEPRTGRSSGATVPGGSAGQVEAGGTTTASAGGEPRRTGASPAAVVQRPDPGPVASGAGPGRRARRSCRCARAHRPQASATAGSPRPAGVRRARRGRRWPPRSCPVPRRRTSPTPRRTARTRPGRGPRVSSCRCQRGVHLGPQHRVEPLRGQRGDHPVVEHPGGVHHRGQRVRRRRSSASRVASARGRRRRRPRRSPRRRARPARPASSRRGRPPAARRLGEQQVPHARAATRCRATSAPSAPVPPVISTVPSGSERGGHA